MHAPNAHAEASPPTPPLIIEASAAAERALADLLDRRRRIGAWDFAAGALAVAAGAAAFWLPPLSAALGGAAAGLMLAKRHRDPMPGFGATCAYFVWANDVRRRAWEAVDEGRDPEWLRAEFEAMDRAYLFVPAGFKPLAEVRGLVFIAKRRLARWLGVSK